MPKDWLSPRCRRQFRAALSLTLVFAIMPFARAQLVLPGAVAPTQEGAVAPAERSQTKSTKPKPKKTAHTGGAARADGGVAGPAIAPKPPKEDNLIGKQLYLDGSRSVMEMSRGDSRLQIARLTLTGDSISRSGESCRVEVSGTPLKLEPRESDSGLNKYRADFPACPFDVEVLDGAVLVSNSGGACELKAADCRSDPAGLWGLGDGDFDPKKAKDMLSARARVEKTVRADFRALYTKNMKDKPLRDLIVRDQAGFSAHREEICRSYVHEEDFGYCALRVTEARALTLGVQLATGVKRPPDLPAADAPPAKGVKAAK